MKIEIETKVLKTTRSEDSVLIKKLNLDYSFEDLQNIINIICKNKDITTFYILDVLFTSGYELITEYEIRLMMLWLEQTAVKQKIKL